MTAKYIQVPENRYRKTTSKYVGTNSEEDNNLVVFSW